MRAASALLALTLASTAHARDTTPASNRAQAAARAFFEATGSPRVNRQDRPRAPASSAPSLGVACAIVTSGAEVIAIMPKSPAEVAGLARGAVITSVNGEPLAGLSPEAIAAALRPATMRVVYGLADGRGLTLMRTAPPETTIAAGSAAD